MRHESRGRRISSKKQMYGLYEAGAFGNKLRTWTSIDELLADDFSGTVSLRYAGKAGGGWAAYEVTVANVTATVDGWIAEGARRELVKVNESAPDERLTIQGEVMEHPQFGGIELRFSDFKGKMREAMRHAEHVHGVEALAVLRDYLSGSSYSDVRELLELYPGAVVEFSAYEMTLGCCRGRNAIVWEVRHY